MKRFWDKVDKSGDCWEWTGGIASATGYGRFWLDGKTISAHRAAWVMHYGAIPKDDSYHKTLFVLHSCDNPKCVNPEHLFLGNNKTNHEDKIKKGRHHPAFGHRHGHTKLTNIHIKVIRGYRHIMTVRNLAKTFNVAESTIHNICHRITWSHVA